jgi:hypothetical protein
VVGDLRHHFQQRLPRPRLPCRREAAMSPYVEVLGALLVLALCAVTMLERDR